MAYRKRRGTDTWHFCTNCSHWPIADYEEKPSQPSSGELCNECRAKKSQGTCRQ
jgi:hypothetical protein